MLSIVALPKPHRGAHERIQRNAVLSWAALPCEKEIFLVGGEEGVDELAREAGATDLGAVHRDEYGTPTLDSIFSRLNARARGDTFCYVNADIILLPQIGPAIDLVRGRFEDYLLVARRWNLDFDSELEFGPGWDVPFARTVKSQGTLFAPQAIDLFVFSRGLYPEVPPFSIGRSYWDNWLVSQARRRGAVVVDGTDEFMIVHQNHDYHGFGSLAEIRRSPQGKRNFYLAGDSHFYHGRTTDSTHVLRDGEVRKAPTPSVSVIIPHSGSIDPLRGCLRTMAYQTYPRTFIEVVVVSNDPSANIGAVAVEFPFVRVTTELQPGPAAARNKGVACSTGEVLAFLDSDCRPTSGWIEAGVAALQGLGGVGVVAGRIERVFPEGRARTVVEAFDLVTFHQQERYVRENGACVAANMFTTRALFREVGPFDESFVEAAGEDWDWSRRATGGGHAIAYAESAMVYHPAIRGWRNLRKKVQRVARGNFQWSQKRPRPSGPAVRGGGGSGGVPVGLLFRRMWRVLAEDRLSRLERCKAVVLQYLVWYWARREVSRLAHRSAQTER